MVLSDKKIIDLVDSGKLVITPFNKEKLSYKTFQSANNVVKKIPTKGLSCCGYDCSLASEFKIADANKNKVLDITDPNSEKWFRLFEQDSIVVPSRSFVLSRTIEYLKLPNNVMGSLYCKSTLARMGLILPPTIIEPGWEGNLVVEIFNCCPFPIRLHADMGIGQIVFYELDQDTSKPYDGKYQGQTGITCAKL